MQGCCCCRCTLLLVPKVFASTSAHRCHVYPFWVLRPPHIPQLLYLDSADPGKDVTLYINSPGGSVTAGACTPACLPAAACGASPAPRPSRSTPCPPALAR